MKVTVEFAKDGMLLVRHGGQQYIALEAAFRTDGAVPMMDLSIPLADPHDEDAQPERPRSRTFDPA